MSDANDVSADVSSADFSVESCKCDRKLHLQRLQLHHPGNVLTSLYKLRKSLCSSISADAKTTT